MPLPAALRRLALALLVPTALAAGATPGGASARTPVVQGLVFEDRDADGHRDADEPGLPGVAISDGRAVVPTGADGRFRMTVEPGATVFAIKPAGWRAHARPGATPRTWVQVPPARALGLRYGGLPAGGRTPSLVLGLVPEPAASTLDVRVFADPQVKHLADVGYYARDVVDSVLATGGTPTLGVTLGDVVDDALDLYPALNAETARMGIPWLHVAGNHDLDFDAPRDEDSLQTFRRTFGPDTFAWEERQAVFVGLDDVIYRPGQRPAYIGGLREDQFAFLEAYLPSVPRDRLLVLMIHIPLFEPEGRDTFRDADRERLFALLARHPRVLVLSGHNHTQRHVFHDARTGWTGAAPLHEYNVGAVCGAYWSGVKDAAGIPDSTMPDGTPNGFASLQVRLGGDYALQWHPARDPAQAGLGVHAPRVLRRGAYPAWAVYANVYMGRDDTRVEFRVGHGEWRPMSRVARPDPRLAAENALDDAALVLRGYDRSPEAEDSPHLWRGALPTDLPVGEHRIEVRAFDAWRGELRATTTYSLQDAAP